MSQRRRVLCIPEVHLPCFNLLRVHLAGAVDDCRCEDADDVARGHTLDTEVPNRCGCHCRPTHHHTGLRPFGLEPQPFLHGRHGRLGLGTTEKLAAPARYRRSIARAGTLTRSPYPRPAEVTALQVRTATSKRASLHNVICTHIKAAAIAHRTKDEIRKVGVMIEEAWMMLDA